MNQWYDSKRRVFILMTLVGAVLMGLVWLAGVSGSARAQGTLLLETSYKDANPRKVGAGGTVAYSIVLHNHNTVSTTGTIVVNDPLAPELSYVSQSAIVVPEDAGHRLPATSGLKFEVYPILPGTTVTLSFQAALTTTVLPGDVITNTATISEGGVAFTRSVTITVADYPSAQINEPWDYQLITFKGPFTVKGRAWTGDDSGFPQPPALTSIVNSGAPDYAVLWSVVPDAFVYVLQESTDPYFSQIRNQYSVTDAASKYVEGQPRGTYYYRVKARILVGSALVDSRWSNVQSVTVTSTALLFEPLSVDPVMPSVAPLMAAAAPTVEVNIKKVGANQPDNWQPATTTADPTGDWWNWTYAWTLPVENDVTQYTIEVRAKDVSGGFDPAQNDKITVNIHNGTRYVYLPFITKRYPPLPYAPTLNVDNNDGYGAYQLSWVYTPATDLYKPTSYTFQEATDAKFAHITRNLLSATSPQVFTEKAVGTYYYRVRGHNAYGYGPWSNVQTIVVKTRTFFDDFSNAGSGWPRAVYWRGTEPKDGQVFDVNYENASYRAKIMLDKEGWNNKRMGVVKAPYTNAFNSYDVEVAHWFSKAGDQVVDPLAGKAGLVFGANGDYSVIYVVEWNYEGQCAVTRYKNVTFPTTIIAYIDDLATYLRGWGGNCNIAVGYNAINTVKVSVVGNQATVIINNKTLGTYNGSNNELSSFHGVGLMTGSWERTPVESRFDNFKVSPR